MSKTNTPVQRISTPVQHKSWPVWPDLSELFPFVSGTGMRSLLHSQVMPLEDGVKDGRYVIRAQIPGIDPAHDVDITVRDGYLTIAAERSEEQNSNTRSEFAYGSLVRSVRLPADADQDDITASYDKGILTVSVGLSQPKSAEKRIPVQSVS